MKTQTRREFLGKLGWMTFGSIFIPYIPKTFYSIPGPESAMQTISIYNGERWVEISSYPSWKSETPQDCIDLIKETGWPNNKKLGSLCFQGA